MPGYDGERFDPPAPIARVTLRGSDRTSVTDVPMLLDSGADVTMVPRAAADQLALGDSDESFRLVARRRHGSMARARYCWRTGGSATWRPAPRRGPSR